MVASFASAVLGAILLVSLPSYASAQDTAARFSPLGGWALQRGTDRCSITRSFGDPNSPYLLSLASIDPWNGGYQVDLAGPAPAVQEGRVSLSWVDGGRTISVSPQNFQDSQGRTWLRFPTPPVAPDIARMTEAEVEEFTQNGGPGEFRRSVSGLAVQNYFSTAIVLETGEIDSVKERLDSCLDSILQANGIAATDINRSDFPTEFLNPQELYRFVLNQVPPAIRGAGRRTMIDFIMYLDDHARPNSCRLSSLPYDPEFERAACDLLLQRASFRFKPGEAGRPTFYKVSVLYENG